MEWVVIPMPGPIHMTVRSYMKFNKNISSLKHYLEKQATTAYYPGGMYPFVSVVIIIYDMAHVYGDIP